MAERSCSRSSAREAGLNAGGCIWERPRASRLGDGMAFALSPDGSMALTMSSGPDPELVLVPTGAGEPVRIRNDGIRNYEAIAWMPDGSQIIFAGSASGQGVRCYIQDIEGGEPRPITPQGNWFGLGQSAVSPDGEWSAAERVDGPPSLFPVGGGEAQQIPGVEPQDNSLPGAPMAAQSLCAPNWKCHEGSTGWTSPRARDLSGKPLYLLTGSAYSEFGPSRSRLTNSPIVTATGKHLGPSRAFRSR